VSKPFFDARECRLHDGLPGDGQRLQGTGHSAVAVAVRVNHDEVQVGHGAPDERIDVEVGAQAGGKFLHQRGHDEWLRHLAR
jgi:hypothetical protein